MESLIGREIRGFRFEGGPGFTVDMEKHIGEIGKIETEGKDYCTVRFNKNKRWSYPLPELLEHLVDKEPEEEIDINALFEKIKQL